MIRSLFTLATLLVLASASVAAEVVSVQMIWDQAPHNAFTDLIRHKDEWFCVFCEGTGHVSADGALRVLVSQDGDTWTSAALIRSEQGDLRDAKIVVTPAGKLMLCGAVAFPKGQAHRHQSLAWFSEDGRTWSREVPIGEPDYWLWRVTWHGNAAYGVGYSTNPMNKTKLYRSTDGRQFDVWVESLYTEDKPTEASIIFRKDGTALCLQRQDGKRGIGQLGVAKAPYQSWTWKDVGTRIGGPALLETPSGQIVTVVRLYDKKVRTSVCELDVTTGTLKEVAPLPSGGDTSYAGLAMHDGLLWVSYYSSHEKKTKIYLAKVKLDQLK